jgi:hypothetical protein
MEKEIYGLNQGRPRPPYQPKNIQCKGCGAGLSVKDEHAELVVCDYCGSHLDVSAPEQKVLSGGADAPVTFRRTSSAKAAAPTRR